MNATALYHDFMRTNPRPAPCGHHWPDKCRFCDKPELSICEWDDCPHDPNGEKPDAPQHWTDAYVCGILFDGYFHADCWETEQERRADRSCR